MPQKSTYFSSGSAVLIIGLQVLGKHRVRIRYHCSPFPEFKICISNYVELIIYARDCCGTKIYCGAKNLTDSGNPEVYNDNVWLLNQVGIAADTIRWIGASIAALPKITSYIQPY